MLPVTRTPRRTGDFNKPFACGRKAHVRATAPQDAVPRSGSMSVGLADARQVPRCGAGGAEGWCPPIVQHPCFKPRNDPVTHRIVPWHLLSGEFRGERAQFWIGRHPFHELVGNERLGIGVRGNRPDLDISSCWALRVGYPTSPHVTVRGLMRASRTSSSCMTTRVWASSAPNGSSINSTSGSSR